MTIVSLFGKLMENVIETNRLNKQEINEKKAKNIALKSNTQKNDELNEGVVEFNDNENLNLVVKKFKKFSQEKRR